MERVLYSFADWGLEPRTKGVIMNRVLLFVLISPLGLCHPLFAADVEKDSVAKAYEKAANLNEASFVTEIVFDKGSSELSADGKSQLRDILNAAKGKGKIEEVKILSWADTEYPSKGRLGKDATKLADERSAEIE